VTFLDVIYVRLLYLIKFTHLLTYLQRNPACFSPSHMNQPTFCIVIFINLARAYALYMHLMAISRQTFHF